MASERPATPWYWTPQTLHEFWFALSWTVLGGIIADLGLVGVVVVASLVGQILSIVAAWAGILLLFVMIYVKLHGRKKSEATYQPLPLAQTVSTEL
jgi:hypothetical protein